MHTASIKGQNSSSHLVNGPTQNQSNSAEISNDNAQNSLLEELTHQYRQSCEQQQNDEEQFSVAAPSELQEEDDNICYTESIKDSQEDGSESASLSLSQHQDHIAIQEKELLAANVPYGSNTVPAKNMDTIIVEEDDNMATSSDQVVEFDNPYAMISRDEFGGNDSSNNDYVDGDDDKNQNQNLNSYQHRRQDSRSGAGRIIQNMRNRSISGEKTKQQPKIANQEIDYLQYAAGMIQGIENSSDKQHLQNLQQQTPQQNQNNAGGSNRLTVGTNEAGSQGDGGSPSCYRAVIAAASTNMYRSSHCSAYMQNNCIFDADDESEHQRDSYMRLLQSQNSQKQQNLVGSVVNMKVAGPSAISGLVLLTKSPSEHMMSISEEQSTRKHHLKSGSMPEFQSLKNNGSGNQNNSASIINAKNDNINSSKDQNLCSFSLQDKSDNIAMNPKNYDKNVDGQEQQDPNSQTKDNDADMQDSLQQRTDRGEETRNNHLDDAAEAVKSSSNVSKKEVSQQNAYQDSLESLTPRSQSTPVQDVIAKTVLLSGVSATEIQNNSLNRKDQYDPTNVSHKRMFMPQAYPPPSRNKTPSQLRDGSKSPISDNGASTNGRLFQQVQDSASISMINNQPLITNTNTASATVKLNLSAKNVNAVNESSTSILHTDQSPSFRQQTFKPLELKKYMMNSNTTADNREQDNNFSHPLVQHINREKAKTPDLDLSSYSIKGDVDNHLGSLGTGNAATSSQYSGAPTPNTKSVQELHYRNNELQTRIGNLEQVLMARLAQTRDDKSPVNHENTGVDTTLHARVSPLITSQSKAVNGGVGGTNYLVSSHNRSLSQSSGPLSYINTEEHHQSKIPAATDEEKSLPITHRFNEEPIMHGLSSQEFISSCQGLASHRSAVDIVKMHHLQFQTQQQTRLAENQYNEDCADKKSRPSIYGSTAYVMTTEQHGARTIGENSSRPNSYINTLHSRAGTNNSTGVINLPHISANGTTRESKRQMNIVEDDDQSRKGMLADTDAEDNGGILSNRDKQEQRRASDSSYSHANTTTNALGNKSTSNMMLDETQPGGGPSLKLHEETEWQKQEQKNSLLRFLENQNAETLKAIQHENSTFIQQCRINDSRDTSFFSADLKQTQEEMRVLDKVNQDHQLFYPQHQHQDPQQLSEFQTTTIHEVNNDSLVDAPQFIDIGDSHYQHFGGQGASYFNNDEADATPAAAGDCGKCRHVFDLNEALSEENDRLRDHMESMILMVQQFDVERARLIELNNAKIDGLEQKVDYLQKDKETAHVSESRDQEETIKSLKAHIRSLEKTNFQNELQSVSVVSCNLSQSLTNGGGVLKNFNAPSQQPTSQQKQRNNRTMDKEWQNRVGCLEHELKQTKDYYLKRIDALEKGGTTTMSYQNATSANAANFSDTTLLVAGESIDGMDHKGIRDSNEDTIHLMTNQDDIIFCRTYEQHCSRLQTEEEGTTDRDNNNANEELMRSQADRHQLYGKLALAEQVLEQITEELNVLSAENKFLAKLNQRLTYHACRQEKYFLDFRKQAQHNSNFKNSQRSSYFGASQSAISTKEVVLQKDAISKERVSQMVEEAESMLRSERKPRQQEQRRKSHTNANTVPVAKPQPTLKPVKHQTIHHQIHQQQKHHTKPQPAKGVVEQKQDLQDCLEVLEIIRVFIRQHPVQFADQVQLQQRREKSSYLKCEQFEKVLTNMNAPISRVETRKLFHFIYTGMQDPTEPHNNGQSQQKKRYLSIADLCKVIDQTNSISTSQTSTQQQLNFTDASQEHHHHDMKNKDSIMRAEELKRQTATIESSEAKTFGGGDQSKGLLVDSLASESNQFMMVNNVNLQLAANNQNHKTSGFHEQDRQVDIVVQDKNQPGNILMMSNALQTNSIIQLEDQLNQQVLLQEAIKTKNAGSRPGCSKNPQQVTAKAPEQSSKAPKNANTSNQQHRRYNTTTDHSESTIEEKPNKVEQLKKRIERMTRQAKKTIHETKNNYDTAKQNQEKLDLLNRSTSEDRATQTITNSNNQYKRRNNSKETPASATLAPVNTQQFLPQQRQHMTTIQH